VSIEEDIAIVLGIQDSREALARIRKFIRCNGNLGLADAAAATAQTMSDKPGTVLDPWSYCIGVHNHNAARAAALYPFLHLLENGMRARVDALLTQRLHADWYLTPESFLPAPVASKFRESETYREIQDRSPGMRAPYPIKRQSSGMEFLRHLSFWGTCRITKELAYRNWGDVFPAKHWQPRQRHDQLWSTLEPVTRLRNEIAHTRGLGLSPYEEARRTVTALLDRLEFDSVKASGRLIEKMQEIHTSFEA
jgi:hypothetical protein